MPYPKCYVVGWPEYQHYMKYDWYLDCHYDATYDEVYIPCEYIDELENIH